MSFELQLNAYKRSLDLILNVLEDQNMANPDQTLNIIPQLVQKIGELEN